MTVIEFPTPLRLPETIGLFRFNPLGFVEHAFPWGRPGTALTNETGLTHCNTMAQGVLHGRIPRYVISPGHAQRTSMRHHSAAGLTAAVDASCAKPIGVSLRAASS